MFFWEIMTLSSYVLVAFDDTPKAHYAAKKYFLMSGIGAVIMLPALLMLQLHNAQELYALLTAKEAINVFLYVCLIALFIGFGVKAGVFHSIHGFPTPTPPRLPLFPLLFPVFLPKRAYMECSFSFQRF